MTGGLWDVKCESAAGFSSIRFYLFILNPEQVEMKICPRIHAHILITETNMEAANTNRLMFYC